MSSNLKSNLTIVVLISLALIVPALGFALAAYLELEHWADDWAAAVWSIAVLSSALYLTYAHKVAAREFGFSALAPFAAVAWLGSSASVGWVANNAWYNYDSFSGYVAPDYSMYQSETHPNHFIFDGPMEIGAAGDLAEYMLGADGVDREKPVVLEINSDGGSPQVGILMGEFISTYNIHVEVVGHCFSACTMALLSSDTRYIHPRAWVGFHDAYVELEDGERYTDADLAFYNQWRDDRLRQVGALEEFIEKASIKDAEGGFYPSYDEMKTNGLINVYERVYLSSSDYPAYL